ncbi:MAG: hypothetical protein IJ144_02860 [Prevotella sp.]|nr:hypothetical protein [Prevotella sp.]
MKLRKIYSHLWMVAIMAVASLLTTACVKDGEKSIVLEGGETAQMIVSNWRVERVELYNVPSETYHSDMPDDVLWGGVLTLDENHVGIFAPRAGQEDNAREFEWDIDGNELSIGGTEYDMISLGRRIMALEVPVVVDGVVFTKRYVLRNLGRGSYTPGGGGNDDPGIGDPDDDDPNIDNDATQTVSSDEGRTFTRNGYTVIVPRGAVPTGTNGQTGNVAFSIQQIGTDELPAGLPSGTTLLPRGAVKIEPMNFVFNSPITINIPLDGNDPDDVAVYWYNPSTGQWELVPFSSINGNGTASISVIELGYFIVVKKPTGNTAYNYGGVHIARQYIENGYYYYLTLVPVSGSNSSKSIAFTSNGQDLYMAGVPMGTYSVTVTREQRSDLTSAATATQTAVVGNVEVKTRLVKGSGGYSTYTGWTEIVLSNLNWTDSRNQTWGEATVTYGTGKFQATLTWYNASGNTVDYDLHLENSNGGHVYWSNMTWGAFKLDRDCIDQLGNVVENIFSVSDDFARGTYRIYVRHFGGATGIRYNCRIIVNGVVVKSVTDICNSGDQNIYTFTVE